MHASLHCVVLLICSIIFTISRSVDCRRGTDTREGRREGIRGEGREEICPSHEFSNFFHDETLNQKPPPNLLLQNALKLTYSKVKTTQFSGGITPGPPLQGRGKRKNGRANEMKGYGPPLFHPSLRLW